MHGKVLPPWALLGSVLLHCALLWGAFRATSDKAVSGLAATPADSWVGQSFELSALLGGPEGASQTQPASEKAPLPASDLPPPASHSPSPEATQAKDKADFASPPASSLASVPRAKAPAPRKKHPPSDSSPLAQPASSAASGSSEGQGSSASGGSFGAAGSAAGVRNLARAFARAIPIANSGDPVWLKLPLGPAGQLEVTFRVDEQGHITSVVPKPAQPPAHLEQLVERTLKLLQAGRFSLSNSSAGVETLRLSVSLSSLEVPAEESSAGPYALGFDPPAVGQPGRAYFTLRTGRHVEVDVQIVARPKALRD